MAVAIISVDFILMEFQLDANVSRKVVSRCRLGRSRAATSSRLLVPTTEQLKSQAARYALVFTKEGRNKSQESTETGSYGCGRGDNHVI